MWETGILKQLLQPIVKLNSANKYVIPLKHIKIKIWYYKDEWIELWNALIVFI